jgi:predicted lipid-binding transport protein (Tim44 family)
MRRPLAENAGKGSDAFAETWHLVKPTDGSHGWNIAGIQQV